MSIFNEPDVLSREGSALLAEPASALPDTPVVSALISHLGQYLTDCSLEFLASLEARLGRLGISTLSQLGDVKVTRDPRSLRRAVEEDSELL